jgi:hypothetical protein
MFSRKTSLQSCNNVADQLPPRPPLSIKETTDTHQILSLTSRNHSCDQSEQLRKINADERMNNIPNGLTNIHNSSPQPSITKNYPISGSNTFSKDRRTRTHKHSLQQGNKWKLLQQKVLGNLDEEKDDEEDLPINQNYGKVHSNIIRIYSS